MRGGREGDDGIKREEMSDRKKNGKWNVKTGDKRDDNIRKDETENEEGETEG